MSDDGDPFGTPPERWKTLVGVVIWAIISVSGLLIFWIVTTKGGQRRDEHE